MQTFDGKQTSDGYTDTCTLSGVWNSNGGFWSITGAEAFVQLQWGRLGTAEWTSEVHVPVGTAILTPPTIGVRFRSYLPGVPATVTAALAGEDEPAIEVGTPTTANVNVTGTFTLIQTQTLGSPAAAVTFASIPATYQDLEVRVAAQSTSVAATTDDLLMQLSGDTGADYSYELVNGTGATASASQALLQTTGNVGVVPTEDGIAAGAFGATIIDILNYAQSGQFHSWLARSSGTAGTGVGYNRTSAGMWTGASELVTSLKLTLSSGSNFPAGSRFSLYGISA